MTENICKHTGRSSSECVLPNVHCRAPDCYEVRAPEKRNDNSDPDRCHPSHVIRMSDASTYDVICVNCRNTDQVPGGWGELRYPCPQLTNKQGIV